MMDYFIDHAAYEDCEIYMPNYGTIKLQRGQVVFGSIVLAKFLGTTRQKTRLRLKILQMTRRLQLLGIALSAALIKIMERFLSLI